MTTSGALRPKSWHTVENGLARQGELMARHCLSKVSVYRYLRQAASGTAPAPPET